MNEVAYTLPYAQGLQIIWAHKAANGEMVKAVVPDRGAGTQAGKFKELMG